MRRTVAFLVAFAVASPAAAAELTKVASSFEKDDPFGLMLDFTFERIQDYGKIVREWYQNDTNQDVSELLYEHYETRLGLDAHIGLYKDLELHVGVPIVFQADRTWRFVNGTNADNTTLYRNCVDAQGHICPTPGRGDGRLFTVGDPTSNSYRSGLGDFTFGLAWSPFNNKKDDTKPTWTLRFDYTAPTATTLNPAVSTSTGARGNIGDRVHRYTFSTGLSKRIGVADPYFQIHYTLPWVGPYWYSNCDSRDDSRMARAQNCGQSVWTRAETGIKPAHVGGFIFGTEVYLFERPDRFQKVALDFRFSGTYVSEGRTYNELSDLMGKLLYTGDYGQIGAQIGVVGQAAEFLLLRASGSFQYFTERFLTAESVGKDIDKSGAIDITANPLEINPNYDYRVDRPGRRFRMQEQFFLKILVTATFNF